MAHLMKNDTFYLDDIIFDKEDIVLCLQEAIKGGGMENSLSTEEVDAMAARVRVVEPDPAPLDTPLAKWPRVMVVEDHPHALETGCIIEWFKQSTLQMNIIDVRLAADESPTESSKKLTSLVKEFQPHILHYCGHGSYDHSYLLHKDDMVDDTDLSIVFQTYQPSLRLVVLGACHSRADQEAQFFLPLAKAFIEKGVPAVVTMWNYKSIDKWALMLQTFYTALAKGKTIRSAAYAAQKAIHDEDASCEPLTLYERTVFGCRKAAFPRKRASVQEQNVAPHQQRSSPPADLTLASAQQDRADSADKVLDGISPTFLAPEGNQAVSLTDLHAVQWDEPDILYSMVHGAIWDGHPYLWLEHDDSTIDLVGRNDSVRSLAELSRRPLLVVLASCQSDGQSRDIGTLVAPRSQLTGAGVGAVVGMQGNVEMATAAKCMSVFFRELVRHGQIGRAMATARAAVWHQIDWWLRERGLREIPTDPLVQAQAQLAALPLDTILDLAALPARSRIPFARNPFFVGHEADLKRLAHTLKGGGTAASGQIAAAIGLGGSGKTNLASEFVHRYGQYFAGVVLWLSFVDAAGVPAEVVACDEPAAMNLSGFEALKFDDQAARIVREWQQPLPGLLIFDNCEDEALLGGWRPTSGGCHMLITSRRLRWDTALRVTLGYLLKVQSGLEGARTHKEQALAVWQAVLGEQHPPTATSLNNLCMLLKDLSNLTEARSYLEQALLICEQVLGPEHPNTQIVRHNLVSLDVPSGAAT